MPDPTSLMQGDVIRRTPEVEALLEEYYPHHKGRADYSFFMVLTQSCDLVRRLKSTSGATCKARYISISAVRPISIVFQREISKFQHNSIESTHRLCDEIYRNHIKDFIARILNNNEPEYFYLHEEPMNGLNQPHCAFLALSIPVKSEAHYDKLLAAKILQLNDNFQHKLGWLTGNLYSRVGTPDWVPDVCPKEEFDKIIEDLLNSYCVWVDPVYKKKLYEHLKTKEKSTLTEREILEVYSTIKDSIPTKKDILVNRITEILTDEGIESKIISKLKNLIMSDSDVATCIKK